MLSHPVARKRCASCDRWQGIRMPDTTPENVLIRDEVDTGLCDGGGWAGSERRARCACGHWRQWREIATTAEMPE